MRRFPLTIAFLLAASSLECTEKLWLPASGVDAATNQGGRGFGDNSGNQGGTGAFGQGGRGAPGPGGGGGRSGFSCPQQPINLPVQKTRLVFSVGKNASMTARPFGNSGGTRLSVVQQMLDSIITDNLNAIAFGYQDFPGTGLCAAGTGCCWDAFIPPASVPPASATYVTIQRSLHCGAPPMTGGCGTTLDSRPITAALQAAASFFNPADSAQHDLLLIVDGDPTSCVAEDPNRTCMLAKAAQSQLMGNVTVVGVGQEAAAANCLMEMANLTPQGSVLLATDPGQLNKILNDRVRAAAAPSCVIGLKTPTDRTTVKLYVNGEEISRDGPDGWDFAAGPVLKMIVRGGSCAKVQRAPEDEIVVLGCPP